MVSGTVNFSALPLPSFVVSLIPEEYVTKLPMLWETLGWAVLPVAAA